jgi:hypothetical protein
MWAVKEITLAERPSPCSWTSTLIPSPAARATAVSCVLTYWFSSKYVPTKPLNQSWSILK